MHMIRLFIYIRFSLQSFFLQSGERIELIRTIFTNEEHQLLDYRVHFSLSFYATLMVYEVNVRKENFKKIESVRVKSLLEILITK